MSMSEQAGAIFILALIMLTQLDGNPVWVEVKQIQAIRPNTHEVKSCAPNAGALVKLGSMSLCVKETPLQIRDKIEGGK